MEMFQYSEKKVRMGWHSPALCTVSSRLSFSVGCTLPSASTGPPAASWRARHLGQCHHKDPWGRTPASSVFSAFLPTLLCGTMLTQPLHRESHPEPTSTYVLSCPASSPFYPQGGEPWRTGHLSPSSVPPGGDEEPGEVELHEIQAGMPVPAGLLCHCSLGQWQWEGAWVSVSGKGLFIKDTAPGDVVVLGPSLSKAGEQDK